MASVILTTAPLLTGQLSLSADLVPEYSSFYLLWIMVHMDWSDSMPSNVAGRKVARSLTFGAP